MAHHHSLRPNFLACVALVFSCGCIANCFAQNTTEEIIYASEVHTESSGRSSGLSTKPQYTLDAGDVLGVFIEGVLGAKDSNPPFQFPDESKNLLASIGYPIPIRDDGTISLPLLKPISLRGFTIQQAEELVKGQYTRQQIVTPNSRIIVSLMRKRTVSVTVIREDNSYSGASTGQFNSRGVNERSDRSARSANLQLPEGDNNVLSALIETGGLPGVNAQPGVTVYRTGSHYDSRNGIHQPFPRTGSTTNGSTTNSYPGSRSQTFPRSNRNRSSSYSPRSARHHVYRSTRANTNYLEANNLEALYGANGRLQNGDIVRVAAKPTEVFYTGGLLRGGEYALPRDKTLDVLEAVSIAGGSIGTTPLGSGSVAPTSLVILRKTAGGQIQIPVDLTEAIHNPALRFPVQAGDYLMLNYQPQEQLLNLGIGTYQTIGLRQLLR